MAGHSPNKVMQKFYSALNCPLQFRCGELTLLIDRSNAKELQHVFPTLLDNIFGSAGAVGWGLRTITTDTNSKDSEILHNFLSPLGPVFRLIYKLLGDNCTYEYPLNLLPSKVRSNLENGRIPPFYSDLLNYDLQTRQLVSLQLNPFDYYMFNFAQHLSYVWHGPCNDQWSGWNTVYYLLACDYLLHFLPTDPNCTILPQIVHFTGKNPSATPLQTANRTQRVSKLFRPQVLQQASVEMTATLTPHQQTQQHPRAHVWRSETVIQAFIDMWLNCDQFLTSENCNFSSKQNAVLLTGEYIRIVRVLVKQLHSFSASSRIDPTPLAELKKVVVSMMQGRMYAFLRHLIHCWPLDGSFRLVLELWLSFIQPWRYQPMHDNFQKRNTGNDIRDDLISSKPIERENLKFMAENLLAYTVILQQLLPRFIRIDLSSPKNAVMIYRVTKVFAQPNLVSMLRDVESCIDSMNHSPSHSYVGYWSSNLPPLSPTTNWSSNTNLRNSSPVINNWNRNFADNSNSINSSPRKQNTVDEVDFNTSFNTPQKNGKWTAVVRQQMFDLEGPEFSYKPMFTAKAASEVIELMRNIQQAIITSKQILQIREEEKSNQQSGVVGFFRSFVSVPQEVVDEFSLEERRKVPIYLDLSLQNLCQIFQLGEPNRLNSTTQLCDTFPSSLVDDTVYMNDTNNLNESCSSEDNVTARLNATLTPDAVRKRARAIVYRGDPDLAPVQSSENAFLVRAFHQISTKINETFADQIQEAFHSDNFYGRLARQIVSPPILVEHYDKTNRQLCRGVAVSPRVRMMLPPRISLRRFASHKFLTWMTLGFIFNKLLGHGVFFFLTCIFFFFLLFISIRVVTDSSFRSRQNFQTQNVRRRLVSENRDSPMDEAF